MRLHLPSAFSLFLSAIDMRRIGKKREEKGEKRKKLASFWKVMSSFSLWYLIHGWCIAIRRLAAAAITAATTAITATGRKKRKRKRKDKIGKVLLRIKQMAVQHKVAVPPYCELTPRPPARSPPLSHAETACRDYIFVFFQLISLTMLSYLIISFIHLLL